MKHQLTLFFTALQFYTRIPAPRWLNHKPENLAQATGYLPLIGWIVGSIGGLSWFIGTYLINDLSIGLWLSIAAAVWTTGAFHEDGLADVCDGFGGGWTSDRILEIMKDSRVGTYGVIGLILMLGFKFLLLQNLAGKLANDFVGLTLMLIAAHAFSRFLPMWVITTQPYARAGQDSKAEPVAQTPHKETIYLGAAFTAVPLFTLAFYAQSPLIFFACILPSMLTLVLSRYFKKWIGGYTGDCLGAIQQVSEVAFYVSLVVLWKYI
jgi:adenosylcobinamide-GDP ribazoletransferase